MSCVLPLPIRQPDRQTGDLHFFCLTVRFLNSHTQQKVCIEGGQNRQTLNWAKLCPTVLGRQIDDIFYLRGSQPAFLPQFLLRALADVAVRNAEDRKETADSI